MRDKGIRTVYDPSIRVTHEGGSSMKKRYLLPYLREKKKWKEKEKALEELIYVLEPERKDEEIYSA